MGHDTYADSYANQLTAKPLIQWRAVFGGGVLGLATMIMLTTLWLALAYASEVETVRANVDWYIGGSAIASMFVGGFLAGWLSGIRGPAAGFVNGATVWAVALIVSVAVAVPATLTRISDAQVTTFSSEATWTTFWSLLIGFGYAAIGGVLGGVIPRRVRRSAIAVQAHDHSEMRVGSRFDREHEALEREALEERDRMETERLNAQAERLRTEAARRRAS